MRRAVPVILTGLFLSFHNPVPAQDAPVVVTDSVTSVQMESNNKAASFSPITQTAPVATRKVPQEKVERLQKSDDYWYANLPPKEEPAPDLKPREKNLFDERWFLNLLWIIILCSFIGIVVWYLASSNISLFRKASKAIGEEGEEEAVSEDIFSIHYEKEIRKAEEAGNYRLAVRLWYLSTLKNLADRAIITYRAETPNGDYLAALSGGRYYRDFFRLTRAFEYTWYGQFPLGEESYKAMQAGFLHFKNSLG